jgi:hypothetical protein
MVTALRHKPVRSLTKDSGARILEEKTMGFASIVETANGREPDRTTGLMTPVLTFIAVPRVVSASAK